MRETARLLIAVFATVLIALGTYGFDNLDTLIPTGYEVKDYSATLDMDGLLNETYTYEVSKGGKFHMLYRSFDTRVDFVPHGECIVPENMSMEPDVGAIAYARSYSGELRTFGESADQYLVENSENNEVGFYAPDTFPAGKYRLNYGFRIFPDIEYDGSHYLLKFNFKTSSYSYGNIRIRIEDRGNVVDVRASAFLDVHRDGSYWVIEGCDDYAFPVTAYIIMDDIGNMTHSEIVRVDDVMKEADHFSIRDSAGYYSLYLPHMAVKWTIYLFPAILVAVYVVFGREKRAYGVEKGRITPPVRRKPWQVNLIFANECEGIDMNGFMATLLDLKRQGKVEITGNSIRLLDANGEDEYEQKVLDFIDDLSEGGYFDPAAFREWAKNAGYDDPERQRARELADSLRDTDDIEKICGDYIWTPKNSMKVLLPIPIIIILVTLIPLAITRDYALFYLLLMMDSLFLMMSLVAAFSHPSLLGRWKGDYYREKLEWDSFARTISDEKRFRDIVAENSSLWDDWLIYGTALGVSKKVRKAMEEAGVNVDSVYMSDDVFKGMGFVYFGAAVSSGSGVSAGGGGFGGGGAGAR